MPIKSLRMVPINRNSIDTEYPPIMLNLQIDGQLMNMLLDTGATVSVLNESDLKRLKIKGELLPSDVRLRAYGNEIITPIGKVLVRVRHTKEESQPIDLYIVKGKFPALFGRPWLHYVELYWQIVRKLICHKTINQTTIIDEKGEFMKKCSQLFSNNLGENEGIPSQDRHEGRCKT